MAVREFLLGEDGYRAAVDAAAGIKTMQSLIFSIVKTWFGRLTAALACQKARLR